MLTAEQIYEATDMGRAVFLYLYPHSADCFERKNKHFKLREDEHTASANYYLNKNGVWKLKDHGGDGKAMSAIDAWMMEHGCSFHEATVQIGAAFGIVDELKPDYNKYRFEKENAPDDMPDGYRPYREKEFTEDELRLLGQSVTREVAESLGWRSLERIGYVKDRQILWYISTPGFPIFMRECVRDDDGRKFYKVYQPCSTDKGRRFQYFPEGVKPLRFINGLREAKAAFDKLNAEAMADFEANPGNEGKPFKPTKLPAVVICSGERDALCCKAMGYPPIWFNSETYDLSAQEYQSICNYAEEVYNIPDLDTTGIRRGSALALKFMQIRTIWLPKSLSEIRDHRGKPKKDLRDWCDYHHSPNDFKALMNGAVCTEFITKKWDSKKECYTYSIMVTRLLEFLKLNGFHTLKDDASPESRYVRIERHIVTELLLRDIPFFVKSWAESHHLNEFERDVIYKTKALTGASLERLDQVNPDFCNNGPTWQLFFTRKECYRVTAQGVSRTTDFSNYVWDSKVIPIDSRLDETPCFEISKESGRYPWRIKVVSTRSPFFSYLINTSRLHWRKEMELRFKDDPAAAQAYAEANRFRIDGEGLEPTEIHEQMQNLVNKIFTIGYLCHRHKEKSRAWAPFAMDNKIGSEGECNGGSGKTVFFNILGHYMRTLQFDGKQKDSDKDKHRYEQVDRHTDLIFVDDCNRYFSIEEYYSVITGDITINVKNKRRYNLPYEESPKIAFNTNYVPNEFSPSTERRLLYMVFSDYYHAGSEENDYLETRKVSSDFGRDLYGPQYTEADWNADLNFIMQCVRFYLWVMSQPNADRILPPMENIFTRRDKAMMENGFEDWASVYFGENSDHVDCKVAKGKAYEDFKRQTGQANIKVTKFKKMLKAFARICPWVEELNPSDVCNSKDGRIIEKTPEGESVEYIYIRTVAKARHAEQRAKQTELPLGGTGECPF